MSRYYRSFLEESGPSYTARTTAFATATGITDLTILGALNTFDLGLISNGLDTKMKALYPFVGSTATTHKFNFMDARDLDIAFRLQFNGGWSFSSTGALPNGTNAFADTYFTPSINFINNSGQVGYYSRTNSEGNSVDVYANAPTGAGIMYGYTNLGAFFYGRFASAEAGYSNSDSRGYYSIDKDYISPSSWNMKLYKNGIYKTGTSGNNAMPNGVITFGGANGGAYSNRQLAMSLISDSFNATEQNNLYTLVQAFQTSLSRQV